MNRWPDRTSLKRITLASFVFAVGLGALRFACCPSATTTTRPPLAPAAIAPDATSLLEWLRAHRDAPTLGTTRRECAHAADLYAGWCSADTVMDAGTPSFSVWWSATNHAAVVVEHASANDGTRDLRCRDLGARTVRRWMFGTTGPISHCVIDGGELGGWHLWVKNTGRGSALSGAVLEDGSAYAADWRDTLAHQGQDLPLDAP